jgi:hypothetical protein
MGAGQHNASQRTRSQGRPLGALRRTTGMAAATLAGIAALTGTLTIGAALPSGAAGNAALSRVIIANPQPGWKLLTKAQLNSYVSGINKAVASELSASDGSVATSANGWRTKDSQKFVLVTLMAVAVKGLTGAPLAQQAQDAAGSAAVSFCSGATNASPQSNVALPAISGSHDATCAATSDGTVLQVITWSKANVVAMLITTTDSESASRFSSIAQAQYKKMSGSGFVVGRG